MDGTRDLKWGMSPIRSSSAEAEGAPTLAITQRNFADGPRGVVGRADEVDLGLRLNLADDLRHQRRDVYAQRPEAGDCHVADQRIRGLAYGCLGMLQILHVNVGSSSEERS